MISHDHAIEEKISEAVDIISVVQKRATKVVYSGSEHTSIVKGRVSLPSKRCKRCR